MISTLIKQNKKNYYDKYFKDNINSIKNTWKGIKPIISLQKTTNNSPRIISLGVHTVTDPRIIENTFNNFDSFNSFNSFNSFFYSVAAEVQSEVSFS